MEGFFAELEFIVMHKGESCVVCHKTEYKGFINDGWKIYGSAPNLDTAHRIADVWATPRGDDE